MTIGIGKTIIITVLLCSSTVNLLAAETQKSNYFEVGYHSYNMVYLNYSKLVFPNSKLNCVATVSGYLGTYFKPLPIPQGNARYERILSILGIWDVQILNYFIKEPNKPNEGIFLGLFFRPYPFHTMPNQTGFGPKIGWKYNIFKGIYWQLEYEQEFYLYYKHPTESSFLRTRFILSNFILCIGIRKQF